MEIKGICRITNKFDSSGNIQKNEYQFEVKKTKTNEQFAVGRLTYSSSKKVNGKYENTYISKSFSCFDSDTINFLANNLGKNIEIVGQLKIENFVDRDNKKQTIEKILINNAYLMVRDRENNPTNDNSNNKTNSTEDTQSFDEVPF